MEQWSEFYRLFGVSQSNSPDKWEILGLSARASQAEIEQGLLARRQLISDSEIDSQLVKEFDSQVLFPAYIAACKEIASYESEDDGEEDEVIGLLSLDLETEDQRYLHDSADHKIDRDEYLSLGELDSSDSSIPLLEPLEDDFDGQTDSDDTAVPLLIEVGDSDDIYSETVEETAGSEVGEFDIEPDDAVPLEIIKEGKGSSPNRLLLFLLIFIPLISFAIFLVFLLNSKSDVPEPVAQVTNQPSTELEVDNSSSFSPESQDVLPSEPIVHTFTQQPVPQHFMQLLDLVRNSFSKDNREDHVLEDIIVLLRAWQYMAGNIDSYPRFEALLQRQEYRSNPTTIVEKDIPMEGLKFLVRDHAEDIALPANYFDNVFSSQSPVHRGRAIELATITNSHGLRNVLIESLENDQEMETVGRIIRGLCVWGSYEAHFELLSSINPAKRDISRRILNNLNGRYANISSSGENIDRYLPYDFTRRDVEKSLLWWQGNLAKLAGSGPANYPARQNASVNTGYLPSEIRAFLLAEVLRVSIILNSTLRSSVNLPVISPELEISTRRIVPLEQALSDSIRQLGSGILAVIYHKYSEKNEVFNEIDIIRLFSHKYDFIDIGQRASARANELLGYCCLTAGQKPELDSQQALSFELISVRDTLWQALNMYAVGEMADYQRKPFVIDDVGLTVSVDFELGGDINAASPVSNSEIVKIQEQIDSEPYSPQLYQQDRLISDSMTADESEGLAFLQLGIKALRNRQSWTATAIAIDCFQRAVQSVSSKAILAKVKPELVGFLMENPDHFCEICGNTGYVICPDCRGMVYQRCLNCKGQGQVTVRLEGRGICPDCYGHGHVPCEKCLGSGVVGCNHCYEYVIGLDILLPNESQLIDLQYAANLATLKLIVSAHLAEK